MELRIISIGTLDAHPLWGERAPVRMGHATTSLIRAKDKTILVDPGLPAPILAARLSERANLTPEDISHVFLTSFRPDVRRGLSAFERATWWISEAERETVGVPMIHSLQHARDEGENDVAEMLQADIKLLQRTHAAPDQLADGVSLFPLPGVTPGLCGLLLAERRHTTLLCGDAVPTIEHLEQGVAPRWAQDVGRARESLTEAIEIADLLVPGRDNLTVNPLRRPF